MSDKTIDALTTLLFLAIALLASDQFLASGLALFGVGFYWVRVVTRREK